MNTMTDNRTAEEVLSGYFAELVKEPVNRTWVPTAFDIEYYGPKRIEKERVKRDADYQKEYEREMRYYNDYKAALDKVCTVDRVLLDFFATSICGAIENLRAKRDGLAEGIKAFRDKWDRDIEFVYKPSNGDEPFQMTCNPLYKKREFIENFWGWEKGRDWRISERARDGHLKPCDDDYHRQNFNAFAPTDEEKVAFLKGVVEYELASAELASLPTIYSLFTRNLVRFAEMVDAIVKTLGGLPDEVTRGAHWGVGGHFNGIVAHQGRRAKFTSFFAGGWNIQCLHIRYRVTALKD